MGENIKKNNNEDIKMIIIGFISLIILVTAIFYAISLTKINNRSYTEGEITRFAFNTNGTEAYIEYLVNGEKHHTWRGSLMDEVNVIGEKFVIVYDSLEPERSLLLLEKPLFSSNENTKYTSGEVVQFYFGCRIRFRYKVNSKVYTKSQSFHKTNYQEYKESLSIGDSCMIKYWVKNPERAILQLDVQGNVSD